MKSIAFMTIILIGFFYFFSCINANSTENIKKPDIVGKITNITQASYEAKKNGRLCTLAVAGVEPNGTEDRAIVTITTKTKIISQKGQPASITDLKEGIQIEVKFTGPVLPSYPVMATAGEVRMFE